MADSSSSSRPDTIPKLVGTPLLRAQLVEIGKFGVVWRICDTGTIVAQFKPQVNVCGL